MSSDDGFKVPGFKPAFRRVDQVRDDNTEPCHRVGGCPFNGRVTKDWAQWYCEYCVADLVRGRRDEVVDATI